jgi:hypothetical protein
MAPKSKPARSGICGVESLSSPTLSITSEDSTTAASCDDEGREMGSSRGGKSLLSTPSVSADIVGLLYGVNEPDDGGREVLAFETAGGLFRANQHFFFEVPSSRTTTRSSVKSGCCIIHSTDLRQSREWKRRIVMILYLRFIKVVSKDREAELIQNERHEGPITHMTRYFIRHIYILQSWNAAYRS